MLDNDICLFVCSQGRINLWTVPPFKVVKIMMFSKYGLFLASFHNISD